MNPKEKAHGLISKFFFSLPNNGLSSSGTNSTQERWKESKICALIAVNEIISNSDKIKSIDKKYWQEVKQEIEKI